MSKTILFEGNFKTKHSQHKKNCLHTQYRKLFLFLI